MVALAAPQHEALMLAGARQSPARLMQYLSHNNSWQRPRHIRFLDDLIADRLRKGNARLLVSVSVRHGKSWETSWATPTWYLDEYPDHSVAMATYQANFSALWGRRVRNTIKRRPGVMRVQVSPDSEAAHSWETTAGGGMHTAGVGGEFTGRGFNLMVVDDPIKNAEQANSEVYREKLIEWYQTTFYTRLEPGGSIIATMARWHEADLFGYLIEEMDNGGEQWEVINLPAIAEANDPLGRNPGEALWPSRRPREDLVGADGEGGIKRAVGSRTWASLYQQRPAPDDGGFFKRESFRYYRRGMTPDGEGLYILSDPKTGATRRVQDSDCWTLITADTAMKEKTMNDYWVLGVWHLERIFDTGADGKTYQRGVTMILRDVWRGQCGAPEGEARFREMYERYKPDFFGIEDKVSGTAVIQRFQRDGIPARAIKADTDKVTRASTAQLWVENSKVWLPLDAPWLSDYESELLVFPNGKHDDQVDMTAHAVNFANNKDMWVAPPPPTYAVNQLGAIAGHDEIEG